MYFTVRATIDEHDTIEYEIRRACKDLNLNFNYYRKFKEGHVWGYRECKILGKSWKIIEMLKDLGIDFDNVNRKIIYKGVKIREYEEEIVLVTPDDLLKSGMVEVVWSKET